MPSYMHVGNPNNIANKVKSIFMGNSDNKAVIVKSIFMGNSDGKATGGYQRVYTTTVTCYSSSVAPGNMSSTTALTRASTSGESYQTRASTSATSYLTRVSTSGTNYGTKTIAAANWNVTSYITSNYQNAYNGRYYTNLVTYHYTFTGLTRTSFTYYDWYDSDGWWTARYVNNVFKMATTTSVTYKSSGTTRGVDAGSRVTTLTQKFTNTSYFAIALECNNRTINSTVTYFVLTRNSNEATGGYHYDARGTSITLSSISAITQTTGTTYLTRSSTSATQYLTRSSTSSTIYLTRSSTSGYTGVSTSTRTSE